MWRKELKKRIPLRHSDAALITFLSKSPWRYAGSLRQDLMAQKNGVEFLCSTADAYSVVYGGCLRLGGRLAQNVVVGVAEKG